MPMKKSARALPSNTSDKAVFPKSIEINGRNYWQLGELRRYIAAAAGKPAPEATRDDERLLSANQVRDLMGGVSQMTLWRWRQKAKAAAAAEGCADGLAP
jgi:hypothetical protein